MTNDQLSALAHCFRVMNAYASGELMGHSQRFSSDPKLVLAEVYGTLGSAFQAEVAEWNTRVDLARTLGIKP